MGQIFKIAAHDEWLESRTCSHPIAPHRCCLGVGDTGACAGSNVFGDGILSPTISLQWAKQNRSSWRPLSHGWR